MLLESIAKSVRHANKQARRLEKLQFKGKVNDAKRLARELRQNTTAIVNDVLLVDDTENRFSN